jgi:protein-S-isoprenylcysteine O-methyltransferase Ste14
MSEPRKFWMRWRVRVGYPVAAIYWLLARPNRESILIGAVVAALGLLVRSLAAGHLRKDRELATSGPYAVTRNPLYFGSALMAAGFIIAGRSWPAGILVGAYFGVFYYFVMRQEEDDLRGRFGETFAQYAERVPLFFPRAPRGKRARDAAAPERFSFAQYLRNREYRALIGTIAGLAVVWLRAWILLRFGY